MVVLLWVNGVLSFVGASPFIGLDEVLSSADGGLAFDVAFLGGFFICQSFVDYWLGFS